MLENTAQGKLAEYRVSAYRLLNVANIVNY